MIFAGTGHLIKYRVPVFCAFFFNNSFGSFLGTEVLQ